MESWSTRRVRPGTAAIAIAIAALAAGCGGLSTVEAEQRCDQERAAEGTGTSCIDDAAYDECVSCYEDCGDDCARGDACPAHFSCPE
jgi:hypothetical protein